MSNVTGENNAVFTRESVPLVVTYVVIGVLIFIGNIAVCFAYITVTSLRTMTNKLVVSSSFAGFLVAVLFVPFYLVLDKITNAVSSIAIPFSSLISSFTGFVTLFNVAALTYDRFIAIFCSLRYHELMTTRKVRFILVAVWGVPLALSLIPVLLANCIKESHIIRLCFKIYQGFLSTLLCIIISVVFAVYIKISVLTRRHFAYDQRFKDSQTTSLSLNTNNEQTSLKFSIFPKISSWFKHRDDESNTPSLYLEELDLLSLDNPLELMSPNCTDSYAFLTSENTRKNSQTRFQQTSSPLTNKELDSASLTNERKSSLQMQKIVKEHRNSTESAVTWSYNKSLKGKDLEVISNVKTVRKIPAVSPRNSDLSKVSFDIDEDTSPSKERDLKQNKIHIKRDNEDYVTVETEHKNKIELPVMKSDYTNNKNESCKLANQRVEISRQSRISSPSFEQNVSNNGNVLNRDSIEKTDHPQEDLLPANCESVKGDYVPNFHQKVSKSKSNDTNSSGNTLKTSGSHTLEKKLNPGKQPRVRSPFSVFKQKEIKSFQNSEENNFKWPTTDGRQSTRNKETARRTRPSLSRNDSSMSFTQWIRGSRGSQSRGSYHHVFTQAKIFLQEIRVAKVIAIIFIVNALCWMPIVFINIADALGHTDIINGDLLLASDLLFMINSLLMPYIYAFCKKDFKDALKKLYNEYRH